MKNDIERLLEGKEAVIFDVDGTLIDSMGLKKYGPSPIHRRSFIHNFIEE